MPQSHDTDPIMWVPSMDAVLSRWFTSYEEARSSLEAEGGYLLPYRAHYFVTSTAAIRELGLDPADPDWEPRRTKCPPWTSRPTSPSCGSPAVSKRKRSINTKRMDNPCEA